MLSARSTVPVTHDMTLLAQLCSNDRTLQLYAMGPLAESIKAAAAIRDLLSVWVYAKPLVLILGSEDPQLQKYAALCLAHLAVGDGMNHLVDVPGAVPAIVKLLVSGAEAETRRHCAFAISNIACQRSGRQQLDQHLSLTDSLGVLLGSTDLETRRYAALALSNYTCDKLSQSIIESSGMRTLLQRLLGLVADPADAETGFNCLNTVAHLLYHSEFLQEVVGSNVTAVSIIAEALLSRILEHSRAAALALSSLSANSEVHPYLVAREAGLLRAVVKVLQGSDDEQTTRMGSRVIANLSRNTNHRVEISDTPGLILVLTTLLRADSLETKKHAALSLAYLFRDRDVVDSQMNSPGIVAGLSAAVLDPDVPTHTFAAVALANIMFIRPDSHNAVINTPDMAAAVCRLLGTADEHALRSGSVICCYMTKYPEGRNQFCALNIKMGSLLYRAVSSGDDVTAQHGALAFANLTHHPEALEGELEGVNGQQFVIAACTLCASTNPSSSQIGFRLLAILSRYPPLHGSVSSQRVIFEILNGLDGSSSEIHRYAAVVLANVTTTHSLQYGVARTPRLITSLIRTLRNSFHTNMEREGEKIVCDALTALANLSSNSECHLVLGEMTDILIELTLTPVSILIATHAARAIANLSANDEIRNIFANDSRRELMLSTLAQWISVNDSQLTLFGIAALANLCYRSQQMQLAVLSHSQWMATLHHTLHSENSGVRRFGARAIANLCAHPHATSVLASSSDFLFALQEAAESVDLDVGKNAQRALAQLQGDKLSPYIASTSIKTTPTFPLSDWVLRTPLPPTPSDAHLQPKIFSTDQTPTTRVSTPPMMLPPDPQPIHHSAAPAAYLPWSMPLSPSADYRLHEPATPSTQNRLIQASSPIALPTPPSTSLYTSPRVSSAAFPLLNPLFPAPARVELESSFQQARARELAPPYTPSVQPQKEQLYRPSPISNAAYTYVPPRETEQRVESSQSWRLRDSYYSPHGPSLM